MAAITARRSQQSGRPSKLTDAQWAAARLCRIRGESAASVARALGVSRSAIYARFGGRRAIIESVAVECFNACAKFNRLNPQDRAIVLDVARGLLDPPERDERTFSWLAPAT